MLRVETPASRSPEREYIVETVVGELLGLQHVQATSERRDVEITLAGDATGGRLTLDDTFLAVPEEHWLTEAALPAGPLEIWDTTDTRLEPTLVSPSLPVLFGKRVSGGSFYERAGPAAQLGLDVFGGAFFMLTRYEELARPVRDERDRFPSSAALAFREGFLDRPLVDEYAEVLWAALHDLWPGLERRQRVFRVLPTHDVDWPSCRESTSRAVARRALSDAFRGRDVVLARDRVTSARRRRRHGPEHDLCFTFDFIMDASEERGLTSTFNFIVEHTAGELDGNYSIDDPPIRSLLRRIRERGHQIGLHPSYETFRDEAQTRHEFERLVQACAEEGIYQDRWASRQHFLRFENPTTWRNLDRAGVHYDSTLGFSDRVGFRSGTCIEHPVYDLLARRRLAVREQPLVVMEMALVEEHDLHFEHALERELERALERIALMRGRCRTFGGQLVLLWHNSSLISRKARRAYLSALGQQ